MLAHRHPSPDPQARPGAVPAVVVAVATFLLLRRILAPLGLVGVSVAEWVGMAGVLMAWATGRGLGPGVLLRVGGGPGVRPGVGLQGWAAALLVGCAGIPVAWFVTWVQGDWLAPDPTVVDALSRQLLAGSGPELLGLVAAAALTPAICEELVFRGSLLDALLRRWPPRAAILLSGLAFGLLHWVPGGEFRVLPTAALGSLLGWLAWRTGSAVPAMVGHAVHNTLVLASAAWAAQTGRSPVWGIRGTEALPPPLWLALGGVAILWLVHRLLRDPGEPTRADPGSSATSSRNSPDP